MLLRVQFPKHRRLLLTLKPTIISNQDIVIQIVHCRNDHWVVASIIVKTGNVLVYNSLFHELDQSTCEAVKGNFGSSCTMELVSGCPRQVGALDCGVFQ